MCFGISIVLCNLEDNEKKKKKLLGSGDFGFSIAFLRFRQYLTIFDCFSGHLLRGFLAFFSVKFVF